MARFLVCFDCARELMSSGGVLLQGTAEAPIEIDPGRLCDMHGNDQALRAVEFHGELPAPKWCGGTPGAGDEARAMATIEARERRERARGRRRATMRVPLGPETEIATRILVALIPDGTVLDDPKLVRRAVAVSRMLLDETENG